MRGLNDNSYFNLPSDSPHSIRLTRLESAFARIDSQAIHNQLSSFPNA
jgi:hypothetical protein